MQTTTIRTEWVWTNERILAAVNATGRRAVKVFRSSGLSCYVTLADGSQLYIRDCQRLDHVGDVR